MSTASEGNGGFVAFYREYAHTSIHTVTATALTAFGLLTFVHRGFVLLAIAVYVLPPIYLYLTRDGEAPEPVVDDAETSGAAGSERPAASESVPASGAEVAGDGTATCDGEPAQPGETTEPGTSEPTATGVTAVGGDGEETPGAASTAESTTGGTETGSTDEGAPEAGSEIAPGSPGGDTDDEPSAVDGVTDADGGSDEWIEAASPTEETLFDAVITADDAYAAGTNGVLLAREGEWELALEGGPAAESTTLRGVDATDDGSAIWVAGDGGVLGRYDPAAGRHTDHSAPRDITDSWTDLAVAGTVGEERVALVNGSGQVLLGEYDGAEVAWDEPVKPGSGSSMSAIEFVDDATGYCCDTNAGVYRLDGEGFERVGIGDASGFSALAATEETVAVAGDGLIQRFDGSVWTPVRVSDGTLSGLDTDGEEWLAVGADGAIYENDGSDWEPADSPTEADLHGVAVGDPSVAVGADGTILDRTG